MTRTPAVKPQGRKSGAAKALDAAVKPAERVGQAVGQTIERALDPLASVLKRAALQRADRDSKQFKTAAGAKSDAKASGLISPLRS